MLLGRESLENHGQIPKKAYIPNVRACEGFSYVWRVGPSLHRKSIDSLINAPVLHFVSTFVIATVVVRA